MELSKCSFRFPLFNISVGHCKQEDFKEVDSIPEFNFTQTLKISKYGSYRAIRYDQDGTVKVLDGSSGKRGEGWGVSLGVRSFLGVFVTSEDSREIEDTNKKAPMYSELRINDITKVENLNSVTIYENGSYLLDYEYPWKHNTFVGTTFKSSCVDSCDGPLKAVTANQATHEGLIQEV